MSEQSTLVSGQWERFRIRSSMLLGPCDAASCIVVAWNSILSGFSQNGSAHEALILFNRMVAKSISPDAVTVVTLFSDCASVGDLLIGSSLHAYSVKLGFLSSSNVYIGTALLDFYAKCGDVKSARSVFNAMEEKNTITWSAMIGGYGNQGDANGSLFSFFSLCRSASKECLNQGAVAPFAMHVYQEVLTLTLFYPKSSQPLWGTWSSFKTL